jgi:hypothetical protein
MGHILYVKTIAGTMVATIMVGESRILVVLVLGGVVWMT